VAQAATALQAVHDRGIVHRGLRPGRLLVRPDGTVVLSVFGLEHLFTQPNGLNALFDRPHCAAPELMMGEGATYRSDVYSLGVIAYHCLSGRRPFEAEHPMQLALSIVREDPPPMPPDVPAAARSIVDRAMAKDPADRWPTAAALAAAARGG
jgi:serine/threonine-protein kinase